MRKLGWLVKNSSIRLLHDLQIIILLWLISIYVTSVAGVFIIGIDTFFPNMIAISIFLIFTALGIIIGSRDQNNNINLRDPKLPQEKEEPAKVNTGFTTLTPFSAYIETRGIYGTIVLIAGTKEKAKLNIIRKFPDCKILHFEEWLKDENYILSKRLDD